MAHQSASWPKIWSTEAETDLQTRLSRLPFYAPSGFGGVIEDLQSILQKAPALLQKGVVIIDKAGPHLDTVLKVTEDPALPQLVDRIKKMQAVQAQKAAKAAPSGVSPTPAPGVGLKRVLPLWDAAIFYEKHPYAPWLIGVGAVLTLGGLGFGIGYAVGRRRTRKAG